MGAHGDTGTRVEERGGQPPEKEIAGRAVEAPPGVRLELAGEFEGELAAARIGGADLIRRGQRRQLSADRRHWQRWLTNVDGDLAREPQRIADFYRTRSSRLEPVGLAYLGPVTG